MTKSFTSGMLKWGKAVTYLYYNPRVCLSRKTQVAKCISNCCVSSLVKTRISTKISLLRLSPSQRFRTHQPSALKIQNIFITTWFLSTRRIHIAISSCLFQTIAVSLPPLCQKKTFWKYFTHQNSSAEQKKEGQPAGVPAVAISSAYHAQECQKARANRRHSPNMVLQ